MDCDYVVGYDSHLNRNHVWRVYVELPMQDAPEDVPNSLTVGVDVISTTKDLAMYIVSTMYPYFDSISCDDFPLSAQSCGICTSTPRRLFL